MTPVEIAEQIRAAVDRLAPATELVATERLAARAAIRDYKLALAERRQGDSGPRADREDRALICCNHLWLKMDTAEVCAKRAEDLKRDLENELSSLQSEAKLIQQAYNTGR